MFYRIENIYPNAYVMGKDFDWDTFSFVEPSEIRNLDDGFDVYATEAFNAPDGRILSVSWIGLPDIKYPSDVEGWANCYSLIKELKIRNNQLYQLPVQENDKLSIGNFNTKGIAPQTKLSGTVDNNTVAKLTIKTEQSDELQVRIDTTNGKIIVDRTKMGIPFATDFGTTREAVISTGKITFDFYLDNTVFEMYLNQG
jgi:Beta-fructosidases (levanase/invertase)